MMDIQWVWLGATLLLLNAMYYPIHYTLLNWNTRYRNLKGGYGRQLYVVKNLMKGAYLHGLSYVTFEVVADTFEGKWNNSAFHNIALFYVVGDMIALVRYYLFAAPALKSGTIYHHISACGLAIACMFVDYTSFTYWRWVVIYCYASAVTGIVNIYLGGRLLVDPKSRGIKIFALISLVIYGAALLCNWGFQLGWLVWFLVHKVQVFTLSLYDAFAIGIGAAFLFFIVKDDIQLVTYLWRTSPKLTR